MCEDEACRRLGVADIGFRNCAHDGDQKSGTHHHHHWEAGTRIGQQPQKLDSKNSTARQVVEAKKMPWLRAGLHFYK
jgi:hypothetical protein